MASSDCLYGMINKTHEPHPIHRPTNGNNASLMQFHYDFSSVCVASLKSFGERTVGLFDRKKKDAEKLAEEKAEEAKKIAEEQARTLGESIGKTKSEAEQLAASTGNDDDSIVISSVR